MKLAEANYDNAETGCCAKLDAELWEGRRLEWNEKPFLKDHIRSFTFLTKTFEGPYRNVGKWMEEMDRYVTDQGLQSKRTISSTQPAPSARNTTARTQWSCLRRLNDEEGNQEMGR